MAENEKITIDSIFNQIPSNITKYLTQSVYDTVDINYLKNTRPDPFLQHLTVTENYITWYDVSIITKFTSPKPTITSVLGYKNSYILHPVLADFWYSSKNNKDNNTVVFTGFLYDFSENSYSLPSNSMNILHYGFNYYKLENMFFTKPSNMRNNILVIHQRNDMGKWLYCDNTKSEITIASKTIKPIYTYEQLLSQYSSSKIDSLIKNVKISQYYFNNYLSEKEQYTYVMEDNDNYYYHGQSLYNIFNILVVPKQSLDKNFYIIKPNDSQTPVDNTYFDLNNFNLINQKILINNQSYFVTKNIQILKQENALYESASKAGYNKLSNPAWQINNNTIYPTITNSDIDILYGYNKINDKQKSTITLYINKKLQTYDISFTGTDDDPKFKKYVPSDIAKKIEIFNVLLPTCENINKTLNDYNTYRLSINIDNQSVLFQFSSIENNNVFCFIPINTKFEAYTAKLSSPNNGLKNVTLNMYHKDSKNPRLTQTFNFSEIVDNDYPSEIYILGFDDICGKYNSSFYNKHNYYSQKLYYKTKGLLIHSAPKYILIATDLSLGSHSYSTNLSENCYAQIRTSTQIFLCKNKQYKLQFQYEPNNKLYYNCTHFTVFGHDSLNQGIYQIITNPVNTQFCVFNNINNQNIAALIYYCYLNQKKYIYDSVYIFRKNYLQKDIVFKSTYYKDTISSDKNTLYINGLNKPHFNYVKNEGENRYFLSSDKKSYIYYNKNSNEYELYYYSYIKHNGEYERLSLASDEAIVSKNQMYNNFSNYKKEIGSNENKINASLILSSIYKAIHQMLHVRNTLFKVYYKKGKTYYLNTSDPLTNSTHLVHFSKKSNLNNVHSSLESNKIIYLQDIKNYIMELNKNFNIETAEIDFYTCHSNCHSNCHSDCYVRSRR